jgi:ribokinase
LTLLVFGNGTIDTSYRVDRLPRPGETVLAHDKRVEPGGKGLNQAIVARRAGAAVRLVAACGEDSAAELIRGQLSHEGVSPDDLVVTAPVTDESLILVAEAGENQIVSTADAARSLTSPAAIAAVESLAAGDWLLLQGNLSRQATRAALLCARRLGVHTILNAAPIAFDFGGLLPLIDVLVANEHEAAELGRTDVVDNAASLLVSSGCRAVVVTLGGEGALLARDVSLQRMDAKPVQVVDSAGAGDVLCGVLAAGLSRGGPLQETLGWAMAAASLSVTRRGTTSSFPTADELTELRRRIDVEEER